MSAENSVCLFVICFAICFIDPSDGVDQNCIINEFNDVSRVVQNCNDILMKGIHVPAGKTLNLNLKPDTSLALEGITTFGYAEWDGPLVLINGRGLKVKGALGSKFNGEGAKYWDGKGGQGKPKPVLIRINAPDGGEFHDIHLLNCPERCASIGGKHITITGWNIDVSAGDKNNLGHNTDGFDVSGQDISIRNCVVKTKTTVSW
ncbi:hypothetical protein JTB14_034430 [Gonioctena quinquepunctata]|nr:hypothetical protein JTB14_034430 [Gonioctena quinquepunctata]